MKRQWVIYELVFFLYIESAGDKERAHRYIFMGKTYQSLVNYMTVILEQ